MRTILVVEDDLDVSMLLDYAFRVAGWTVRTAASLAEARAALSEEGIDLVLTDDRLGDGRAEDVRLAAGALPVVLLSASVELVGSLLGD